MKTFVLTGPTASGVTSLSEYLLLQDGDMLAPLVSFTTRKKLPEEKHGREYFFITHEQYVQLKVEGHIAQEFHYLNNHYGLTTGDLHKLEQSRKNGLTAMGMPGIRSLKHFLGEQNVISIFVYRDLSAIRAEIKQRNIPETEKAQRFVSAKKEMLDMGKADHVIYNLGTLKDLYQEAIGLIRSEINTRDQNLYEVGKKYQDANGDVYEALELGYDSLSGQAVAIARHSSGAILTRALRDFLREKREI